MLGNLGTVRAVEKWRGNFPNQMPANAALMIEQVVNACNQAPAGAQVYMGGNSFGCRVAVEILSKHKDKLPDAVAKDRIICFGWVARATTLLVYWLNLNLLNGPQHCSPRQVPALRPQAGRARVRY